MPRHNRATFTWMLPAAALERLNPVDRRSLEMLVGAETALKSYIGKAIRNVDTREDALAECMSATWASLGPESTGASLVSVALTAVRQYCRKMKQRERHEVGGVEIDSILAEAPSLHFELDRAVVSTAIRSMCADEDRRYREALWAYETETMLKHLTPNQRAALELHIMDELTDREIAESAGCSVRSVSHLRRTAIRRCRALIEVAGTPDRPSR